MLGLHAKISLCMNDSKSRVANKKEKTYANAKKVVNSLSSLTTYTKEKRAEKKRQEDLSSFSYCMGVNSM